MKKILLMVIIALQFVNCKAEKEEQNPFVRLLALQLILSKKDITFSKVRYLNDKFYGVGSRGQIYISPDAENWSRITLDTLQTLNDIGFLNNRFTMVGNSVHYTSNDGSTWTDISTTFSSTTFLRSIGNFASTSFMFGSYSFYSTTDGINFNAGGSLTTNSTDSTFVESASSSNRMIIVGRDSISRRGLVRIGTYLLPTIFGFSSSGITGLTTASYFNGIAYNNIRFVAVGDSGNIYYSTEGSSWTTTNSGVTSSIRSIVYANNQFIAVGDSGMILSSQDGINWVTKTSGYTTNLVSVAYGNGKLVAVGKDTILVSADDGATWISK